MTLDEELDYVEQHYPQAWRFLIKQDSSKPMRPSFDDDDEMFFTEEERKGKADESIHKPRSFFGL